MRNRGAWRRAIGVLLVLLALLVAVFEIGVRTVTPDAVEYRTETVEPFGRVNVFTSSGTITDPAQIARLRATLMAHPTNTRLWDIAMSHFQGTDACSVGTTFSGTYRFTWHGLPLEVISPAPTCTSQYLISSGGWTDPTAYFVDYPVPLAPPAPPLPGQ